MLRMIKLMLTIWSEVFDLVLQIFRIITIYEYIVFQKVGGCKKKKLCPLIKHYDVHSSSPPPLNTRKNIASAKRKSCRSYGNVYKPGQQ